MPRFWDLLKTCKVSAIGRQPAEPDQQRRTSSEAAKAASFACLLPPLRGSSRLQLRNLRADARS